MSTPSRRDTHYEVEIVGHLSARWAHHFDGMTITAHDDGTSVLSGTIADQSALHGLIRQLSDLGVQLVSVRPTPTDHVFPIPRSTS